MHDFPVLFVSGSAKDIKLKLSENLELDQKTACVSRLSKGCICKISETPEGITLRLSWNAEEDIDLN